MRRLAPQDAGSHCDCLQIAGGTGTDAGGECARRGRACRTRDAGGSRRHHEGPGRGGGEAREGRRRRTGVQGIPRLSVDAVRVGERTGGARHPVESLVERGRHHLARHGREAEWVLWRLGGHRPGRHGVRRGGHAPAHHA